MMLGGEWGQEAGLWELTHDTAPAPSVVAQTHFSKHTAFLNEACAMEDDPSGRMVISLPVPMSLVLLHLHSSRT